MENKLKILVAHPGRQHSFRVAKALKESGMLFKYATTVYNKESSILIKMANLFISEDNKNRAKKRKCPSLEDNDVILFNEFLGFLLLLLLRVDKTKKIYSWLSHKIRDSFGKKVAKYAIKNNIDAIISYDTNSLVCFEYLEKKAPHIKRIMDHAHPPRNYLYKVYQEKLDSAGDFRETYEASGYILNKKIADSFAKEIKLAHLHIAASSFSKKALHFNNVPEENILFCPYGVDVNKNIDFKKQLTNFEKLEVLFVGEINQRKGIAQILESAKLLKNKDVEFNLIGMGKEYKSYLYTNYDDTVNFMGRVSYEVLIEQYTSNHIFIFPSMGEGFGLVLLEAMAAGLPVIASRNCVGPDLIKNGYNGFLIDAGSTEQLTEHILWFKNNQDRLKEMSENARETVDNYSWEKYEKNLVENLSNKLNKEL